jgi:hypothetical protein
MGYSARWGFFCWRFFAALPAIAAVLVDEPPQIAYFLGCQSLAKFDNSGLNLQNLQLRQVAAAGLKLST